MLTIAVCEDDDICKKQLLEILDSMKTEGELQISSSIGTERFNDTPNLEYHKFNIPKIVINLS